MFWVPDIMRAMQAFLLGTTGFLGWPSVALSMCEVYEEAARITRGR